METILIPGAEIYYEKNFLSTEEATSCLTCRGQRAPGNGANLHSNMLCLATRPITATWEPCSPAKGVPGRDYSAQMTRIMNPFTAKYPINRSRALPVKNACSIA